MWKAGSAKVGVFNLHSSRATSRSLDSPRSLRLAGKIDGWTACKDDAVYRASFWHAKQAFLQQLPPEEMTRVDRLSAKPRDDSKGETPGSARGDEEERLFLASLSEDEVGGGLRGTNVGLCDFCVLLRITRPRRGSIWRSRRALGPRRRRRSRGWTGAATTTRSLTCATSLPFPLSVLTAAHPPTPDTEVREVREVDEGAQTWPLEHPGTYYVRSRRGRGGQCA